MRAHTRPLLVDGLGSAEQSCKAMEPIDLRPGNSGIAYDEGWLQSLIQAHPALLPVSEIEPGLFPLVPICMELPVPSGYIDNLMLTPDGGIVVVETKLWRNPQARREVVGQVLDYAKDLASFGYEDLERAAGAALKSPDVRLFDLVSAAVPDIEENRFIDAVARNLRLGRMLLLIAGDGIQEGAEQLAGFLQRHVGLHCTLSLVEMSLWQNPLDKKILVQPRILVRTVQIERAVVRVDTGVTLSPVHIEPASAGSTRASNLSETQFYEALANVSPDLPDRLRAFLDRVADLGIYPVVLRSLSMKWQGPDEQEYNLGSISVNGTLGTEYCNWTPSSIGRVDVAHAYQEDLAAIFPGGSVRQTPLARSWRVIVKDGEPTLEQLLDNEEKWIAATQKFMNAIRAALDEQN